MLYQGRYLVVLEVLRSNSKEILLEFGSHMELSNSKLTLLACYDQKWPTGTRILQFWGGS